MTVRKRFDRELYNANDDAKLLVMAHLGGDWAVGADRYGPDLHSAASDSWAEVEVKKHWVTPPSFPYQTLQIPGRKMRYITDANGKMRDIDFWILSADRSHALVVKGHQVLSSPLVIVPNKYIGYGEKFFQVPIELCKVVQIQISDSAQRS